MSSASTITEQLTPTDNEVSRESVEHVALDNVYFRWKGVLDRLAALILLVPALPLVGMLIILVRMTSRGPGVFKQVRVGRGGRQYTMYKLRSMRCDAEAQTGPAWTKGSGDPRITPLGRWLRKLHLDELPQLLNVLRGEMSLVGPRPERPEFVEVLKEAIPGYERRLVVAPGITGLAQINLPPDTCLDSARRKQLLDLQYVRESSMWLDLRLLVATSMRIVGIPGNLAAWLACVERKVELPALHDTVVDTNQDTLNDSTTLRSLVEKLGNGSSLSNGCASDGYSGNGSHKSGDQVSDCAICRRHPK